MVWDWCRLGHCQWGGMCTRLWLRLISDDRERERSIFCYVLMLHHALASYARLMEIFTVSYKLAYKGKLLDGIWFINYNRINRELLNWLNISIRNNNMSITGGQMDMTIWNSRIKICRHQWFWLNQSCTLGKYKFFLLLIFYWFKKF